MCNKCVRRGDLLLATLFINALKHEMKKGTVSSGIKTSNSVPRRGGINNRNKSIWNRKV